MPVEHMVRSPSVIENKVGHRPLRPFHRDSNQLEPQLPWYSEGISSSIPAFLGRAFRLMSNKLDAYRALNHTFVITVA